MSISCYLSIQIMYINHWQLQTVFKHFQEVQDKVIQVTEEIDSNSQQLYTAFNVNVIIDVLQECNIVISSSKQLVKLHEENIQVRESLEESLKNIEEHRYRLLQQNEILLNNIEQLEQRNKKLDSDIVQIEKKLNIKQIETDKSIKQLIKMSCHQIEEKYEHKISSYKRKINEKDQIIDGLHEQINHLKEQLLLKDNQIELGQLVIQDFLRQRQMYRITKDNNDCPTYSPSINNSEQNSSPVHSETIIRSNIKRNSLMQDFFDSHIRDEQQVRYSSYNYLESPQEIQEVEESKQKENIVIRNHLEITESQTSILSENNKFGQKLAYQTCLFRQFGSTSTQTDDLDASQSSLTFFGWCKQKIITNRIKNH